jgi:serine/threonine protein kinase
MATAGRKGQGSKSSLAVLPKEIPLSFLKEITENFSEDRKIGTSPFGTFYKGILEDGTKIAVKKLQENATLPAGKAFHKEIHHIMVLKHENIVECIGYCSEMQKKLVQINGRYVGAEITESLLCYEFLPNGSLEDLLFAPKAIQPTINWDTRFKIVKGICHGLLYLHKLAIPIVHMDLKPGSILLDENMVPKIGNFGLSRIFGQEQTRMNTQTVVGS